MKILFFTENRYKGGLDTFLVNVVNSWPYAGDELVIICNRSHPGLETLKTEINRPCVYVEHEFLLYSDVVASREKQTSSVGLLKRICLRATRAPLFFLNVFFVFRLFRSLTADRLMVVNGGHPGGDSCRASVIAWWFCRAGRDKAIYNVHNLAHSVRWYEYLSEIALDFLVSRLSKVTICVSSACAESFCIRPLNLFRKKMDYIYNGIADVHVTMSRHVRDEFCVPEGAPICLMLATYEPRKGHTFLLQAFRTVVRSVMDVQLIICGYGGQSEEEVVRECVNELGLTSNVKLLGFVKAKEELIQMADVLVTPSQAFESFGLTNVEAMALHKPVVATTVGGIPEVVSDGISGFCVDPNDIGGFADRIMRLLSSAELRMQMGNAGYERYKTMFTAEIMAEKYAQIIRSAC